MKIIRIILFVVLTGFVGFCAGMFIGAYAAMEIVGLDASLKALEYGMCGAIIGIIVSIMLARAINIFWIRRVFYSMAILSLILVGFIACRIVAKKEQKNSASDELPMHKKTEPVYHFAGYRDIPYELPVGTGLAQPHLSSEKPLYFYGYNAIFSMPEHLVPTDSVTFKSGKYFIDIATAPPYLVPEILKLDYDAFYLRVLTVSKNWLEVIVNNTNGQTAWISRDQANFIDWHDFFLNVAAIELIDEEKNPVRLKPLDHAGILATTPHRFQLKPLAVNGDWIMVSTNGLADRIPPSGWIRWRDGNKLLIKYSILC